MGCSVSPRGVLHSEVPDSANQCAARLLAVVGPGSSVQRQVRTSTAKPEQDEDEMSTESFPYLLKCRLTLTKILRALNLGVYYVGNAIRRLKVSSPEWECLFKPDPVLEQFKAMQTALTVDIFLDVFHKISALADFQGSTDYNSML